MDYLLRDSYLTGVKYGLVYQSQIEKIQSHYTLTEGSVNHEEELREAVKLYDLDSKKMSYLAEDKLSVVNRLANYKSEFIRIYVLEEKDKQYNYEKMHQEIKALITS